MTDKLANGWIQTYSGHKVSLLDPQPNQITIEDIAHALSMVNRYNGHTSFPYSVATHSRHVSKLLSYDIQLSLDGLLHDASEAYVGDVSRPLKALMPQYVEIEQRFSAVIAAKFGLSWPEPERVKWADVQLLISEKEALLGPEPESWNLPPQEVRVLITKESPRESERLFLERFDMLMRNIKVAA